MADFPTSAETINPEWLGDTLETSFPGVSVAAVTVAQQTSGTNRNARLAIEYRQRAGAPETLFAKMPPRNPEQRELVRLSGMAERETGFYRDLADAVDLRVPRAFFSGYDEASGDFLILLEDLAAAGCRFPGPDEGFDFAMAKRAVEDLADLHLRHYSDASLRERSAWVGPQIRLKAYGAGMLSLALQHCRTSLTDDFAELAAYYIEHHDAVHDVWEQGAWSIIHGDCHWGNLFVDEGRIGFLDWGCMAYMPGMREISWFLCAGLTVEGRRRHERDLIAAYLERVKRGGGPPMSADEAWELYRLHAAYTVPASAPASIYELIRDKAGFSPEFVDEFMRRANAAVSDLGAIGALRERVDA
jgi:aminoglycoside phosphotransferase (APT) family kinase protein